MYEKYHPEMKTFQAITYMHAVITVIIDSVLREIIGHLLKNMANIL